MNEFENDFADLDWAAMCYITGEFDGQACREFEQLLETNPAARQAVQRAAQTMQAVCDEVFHGEVAHGEVANGDAGEPPGAVTMAVQKPLAIQKPMAGHTPGTRPWPAAAALATAALVLLMATVWYYVAQQHRPPVASATQDETIALAWVYSLESDLPATSPPDFVVATTELPETFFPLDELGADASQVATPGDDEFAWLGLAVSSLAANSPEQ